ncbi:MAG: hypothetical protein ACKPKO_53695, partial [Candidatus Fonsibacter sp.]
VFQYFLKTKLRKTHLRASKLANQTKFIDESAYTNSCIAYNANSPSNIFPPCKFENTPPSIKLVNK